MTPLFRFAVGSVLVAETAVFFCLHTVRMVFLLFCGVVIALLAILASKGDFGAHEYPSFHIKKTPLGCPKAY